MELAPLRGKVRQSLAASLEPIVKAPDHLNVQLASEEKGQVWGDMRLYTRVRGAVRVVCTRWVCRGLGIQGYADVAVSAGGV